MHIFFADDSAQSSPSREGMGPLLSAGGFFIHADELRTLENELSAICSEFGFPSNSEFKWSPSKHHWMRASLTDQRRTEFFIKVLTALADRGAKAIVVVADRRRIARGTEHEFFVTQLLMERVEMQVGGQQSTCIMIFDRPGGARTEENKFLGRTVKMVQSGSSYVKMKSFAMTPLSTESQHVRCLQAADLVTAASTAVIAGQTTHTPEVWELIKKMFVCSWRGQRGGTGCKIYGKRCEYHNLYHWLLGDDAAEYVGIPYRGWHYSKDANTYLPPSP